MKHDSSTQTPLLALTGERTIPGVPEENYWFTRHMVAYSLALSMVEDKRVLDIGCGEGYGPDLLATRASQVIGLDVAPDVIEHARANYKRDNLEFMFGDVNSLPFPDNSFDVCVSLQVIEHLEELDGYFEEMKRVLSGGGFALITTPNRLTISPGSEEPINPFHLREYTPREFRDLAKTRFFRVEVLGVFHARKLLINQYLRLVDFIKYYEMGRWNPRRTLHRWLTPRITTDDFAIKNRGLESSLDIIALCTKGDLK